MREIEAKIMDLYDIYNILNVAVIIRNGKIHRLMREVDDDENDTEIPHA